MGCYLSLYADYIKERENFKIIETDYAFVSFKFFDGECYIRDVYVKPEYRKQGVASQLVDAIAALAKDKCKYLTTSVSPIANGSQDSLNACIAYGFKLLRSDNQLIYLIKELK